MNSEFNREPHEDGSGLNFQSSSQSGFPENRPTQYRYRYRKFDLLSGLSCQSSVPKQRHAQCRADLGQGPGHALKNVNTTNHQNRQKVSNSICLRGNRVISHLIGIILAFKSKIAFKKLTVTCVNARAPAEEASTPSTTGWFSRAQ